MQFGQTFVGNLELYPPRRIGFDEVDEVPGNASRRDLPQQSPQREHGTTPFSRRRIAPRTPTSTDVTRKPGRLLRGLRLQVHIIDADDLAPMYVNDLLVEQVPL